MDDLDRLYRRLIQNIRAKRPEYLQIPFTVQELYEQLVPYRHNRREMAIETNQDYESAIARLLSGERGYVHADQAMQEALVRELNSPTGDPGIFKDYAQAQISLAPTNDQIVTPAVPMSVAEPQERQEPRESQPATTVKDVAEVYDIESPATGAAPVAAAPVTPTATLLSSLSSVSVPTGCRFCGGTLPEGRDVHYCPHCGENLKTRRCPACGAEMEAGWTFCVTCGRRAVG